MSEHYGPATLTLKINHGESQYVLQNISPLD